MNTSSLNDIDGDDDDDDDDHNTMDTTSKNNIADEESTISIAADEELSLMDDASDVDSILAMAQRLDDASAISDPSFIEGVS
jgi:hypothetical protein